MYPNLKAELARRNITYEMLADKLNISVSSVCLKLNGKSPITLIEAKQIKKIVNTDLPIEKLFEEATE